MNQFQIINRTIKTLDKIVYWKLPYILSSKFQDDSLSTWRNAILRIIRDVYVKNNMSLNCDILSEMDNILYNDVKYQEYKLIAPKSHRFRYDDYLKHGFNIDGVLIRAEILRMIK